MTTQTTEHREPVIDLTEVTPHRHIKDQPVLQAGAELYLQNGFLLMRNAFPPGFIAGLADAFSARYDAYFQDRIYDDALDVGHRRTMVTIALDGPFNTPDFYAPPRIFPLLSFLLSKQLILGGLGCVVSLPGSKPQHVHRDYRNIYNPGFYYPGVEQVMARGAPYAITLAIPLVRLDERTGNTRFWPGTHLTDIQGKDPKLGPGVDFVAEVGDAILFDYRVLHAGVPNRSDTIRPLIYNIYTRPWFRDPVNYSRQDPIHISRERLEEIPKDYRSLFEWAVDGPRTLQNRDETPEG